MNPAPHRHFHDELARLKETVLLMSGRAEDALGRGVESFLGGNEEEARQVVEEDREIDQLEIDIEETVTNLLALHQPVARDLRLILASLKIANDLERVADHAVNIAKSTLRMRAGGPIHADPELVEMGKLARAMLGDTLSAFVRGDSQAARQVCIRDDEMDALNRTLFKMMMTRMTEHSETVDFAMQVLLVSRNLERVGDMATNIAEDVVFLVEGTSIKHGAGVKTAGR
jgi:phosphate transport system protein